jgi:alkylation response protein AidB-like acyl-CoA dehydrogenase
MDFELTLEQQKLQDSAIEFARSALATDMRERERAETFDRTLWAQCARFGVLGMPIPEEHGGLGLGLIDLIAVMEGLGYGTRDQGLSIPRSARPRRSRSAMPRACASSCICRSKAPFGRRLST